MSAHGEGTGFLLAPTQIASPQSVSITWTTAQRSLHHALGFQSHFHRDRLSSFWKTPLSPTGTLLVPLLPVTGTLSLCFLLLGLCFLLHFLRRSPLLSVTFWISHLLCVVFSFAASWTPGLNSHSLHFLLLILLYLFPHPFSQSDARKSCLEHTSQPFNWRH